MKARNFHTPFPGVTVLAAVFSLAGLKAQDNDKPKAEPEAAGDKIEDIRAVIKTNKGDIKIVLFATKAPVTAANFLNLGKRNYYDGILVHRVVPGFVIQAGDPLTLDPEREAEWGRGGPGYFIELEVDSGLKHHSAGVLSMARKPDPNTAGSQFFITLDATPHLDGQYAVFGEVTEGVEIVKSIEVGDKITDVEVLDSTDALFTKLEKRIAEWNRKLEQRNRAEAEGEKEKENQ